MPTITQTIAKGIAPRPHLPPKPKKQNSHKRQAGDSNDDESKGSELDDAAPKVKANKHKQPHKVMVELEEVENIDDTTKPGKEVIKEVDDKPGNEVSTNTPVKWHGLTQL